MRWWKIKWVESDCEGTWNVGEVQLHFWSSSGLGSHDSRGDLAILLDVTPPCFEVHVTRDGEEGEELEVEVSNGDGGVPSSSEVIETLWKRENKKNKNKTKNEILKGQKWIFVKTKYS